MTQFDLARTAYGNTAGPVRTPRGMEYEAFARVTRRLKQASAGGPGEFAALARAVHENRRLWTMLALHVAEPSNGLPQDLRARLFYLAEFSNQMASKVLRREAGVDSLLEVNTAVMRGLREREAGQ